jgi:phosphoribosylformylglycinamidine synthase
MLARVFVSLKPSVLDPQGVTICNALRGHGHPAVASVRQGKFFEVRFAADTTREAAEAELETIARDVLANPVIESYRFEFVD